MLRICLNFHQKSGSGMLINVMLIKKHVAFKLKNLLTISKNCLARLLDSVGIQLESMYVYVIQVEAMYVYVNLK